MRAFMDQDFLLKSETARRLYHEHAEQMPIIDYHCHVDPWEIFEDRRFENIYQIWLEGDHYKWRVMRSNGVEERYITGDAPEREKFQKFAEALPRAIGNPMYHWCHLELRTYFGYEGVLNGDTAQEVWDLSIKKLAEPDMSVRGILRQSNVAMVGTTDDPTSDLAWHKRIAEDPGISTVVAPSFRPDKALNIEKPGWAGFLAELGRVSGVEVKDLDSLEAALGQRMDAFDAAGCRAADHGLDYVPFRPAERGQVDAILKKALAGQGVALKEAEQFKTALLLSCAKRYANLNWVMQIHYNCMRNPNSAMFAELKAVGMIRFSRKIDNLNVRVVFMEDGETVLHIQDFRNLGYQYLKYYGGPYFECENCGLTVKIQEPARGRRQKYCPSCAIEVGVRQRVSWVMRERRAARQQALAET